MVQLVSERHEERVGVGLLLIEADDIGKPPMEVLAYDYDENGLAAVRKDKRSEFSEPGEGRTHPLGEELHEYVLDVGAVTATIAKKKSPRTSRWLIQVICLS